jgi:hypothetical protein
VILSLRVFAVKVKLIDANGCHLRYLHAELAKAMVANGSAVISNANGRVKAVAHFQPGPFIRRKLAAMGNPVASPRDSHRRC